MTRMLKRVTAILAMAVALQAASASAQLIVGAGYISQEHTVDFTASGQELTQAKAAWMNGGYLGLSQNLHMFGDLWLAPGAYVSFAKLREIGLVAVGSGNIAQVDSSATTSQFAIRMPFFFNVSFTRLFVFGGPSFNVGLSTITDLQSIQNTTDIHFDMGAAIGAGVKVGFLRAYAGYNFGLITRENFSYSGREAWTEASEGSTLFVGLGIKL